MALKTYSIYTQCARCGVYDRDPAWCDLCGKPKQTSVARGTGGDSVPQEDRVHAVGRDARQDAAVVRG